MATNLEMQEKHNEKLYDLLMIKKENKENESRTNRWLENTIARTKSAMSKEAIAWVEQQVAESK